MSDLYPPGLDDIGMGQTVYEPNRIPSFRLDLY